MTPFLIPFEINPNEQLVRIIFSPLHYSKSKNKFNIEAFLPPPGRNDVSMIRLNYSSPSKCKEIAQKIKINGSFHFGYSMSEMSKFLDTSQAQPDPLNKIKIQATPQPRYLEFNINGYMLAFIYSVPEHADMVYPHPYVSQEKKSYSEFRQFAKRIVSIFNFYEKETDLAS